MATTIGVDRFCPNWIAFAAINIGISRRVDDGLRSQCGEGRAHGGGVRNVENLVDSSSRVCTESDDSHPSRDERGAEIPAELPAGSGDGHCWRRIGHPTFTTE
jgi:hypothetical protein